MLFSEIIWPSKPERIIAMVPPAFPSACKFKLERACCRHEVYFHARL